MHTADAFEMGLRSARPGLLFDTMELVAALSVSMGGFDRLESFVRTLSDLQRESMDDLEWITALAGAAFREPLSIPDGVDEYRTFLTQRVFEIVNRWSYIQDIHTVKRLQAWFYSGFALGRAVTILRGLQYFEELRNLCGVIPPLDQVPRQLTRMAQEASRQLAVVAEEDDFTVIDTILTHASERLNGYALLCQKSAEALTVPSALADDLQYFGELIAQRTKDSRLGGVHT